MIHCCEKYVRSPPYIGVDVSAEAQGQVHTSFALPQAGPRGVGLLVGAVLVAQNATVTATQAQGVTLHAIPQHQFVKSDSRNIYTETIVI